MRTRGRGGRAPDRRRAAPARAAGRRTWPSRSARRRESEASSVTASTWNFSRGHERNPYSRASASCASAIDGNSPALRRRLASSRRWRRSGRDGRERGSDMSAPLGLRRVRTPGRESRPSPVASHSHHSWACGPFRGPGASCTHPVTIPKRRATERSVTAPPGDGLAARPARHGCRAEPAPRTPSEARPIPGHKCTLGTRS